MPKKIIRLTESDIEKIVRRVIKEQNNVEGSIQRDFTTFSEKPEIFKYGPIDSNDKLKEFLNWYKNNEDVAIDILSKSGLSLVTQTDRFDEKDAKSNIVNLIYTITQDLITLSKLPPNVVNEQNIKYRLDRGELGNNVKNFKITEKYSNYPEVLFKIYQQQLDSIGK